MCFGWARTTFCRSAQTFHFRTECYDYRRVCGFVCVCAWCAMCMSSYVHDFINKTINYYPLRFRWRHNWSIQTQTKSFHVKADISQQYTAMTHDPNSHDLFRPCLFSTYRRGCSTIFLLFWFRQYPMKCPIFTLLLPFFVPTCHTVFVNSQMSSE